MLTQDHPRNVALLDKTLRIENSFDILPRTLEFGGRQARMYTIDGMNEDNVVNKIIETLFKLEETQLGELKTPRELADKTVPYGEVDLVDNEKDFAVWVLSGCVGLIVEGFAEGIVIDVRSHPARPVMEPENDRVLRGPREGFVETLVVNTALIRRHLRSPNLTMEAVRVGRTSRSDVVLCYMHGKADPKLVEKLRGKLNGIGINTLTMGVESLTECLTRKQWWNPFPRARYTERPDTAAACVAEGQIILMMDNSPAAMILPTGIFDFLQDTNDYSFLPVTGVYLRWLRLLITVLMTVLTPLWMMAVKYNDRLPDFLNFLALEEAPTIPVFAQLIVIEIVLAALRMASLNTPAALIGSFGIVGALLLGEVAVISELLIPETVLMMGFVALGNFAQPSHELGYALTFVRMFTLVLVWLFSFWGFVAGMVLMLLLISITKTVSGTSYWYPLIPFNGRALGRLFFRVPIKHDNS